MKNCLILGSGRSGTSMVTGTLSSAGYFMGEGLYPGRHSNPKGFFEAREINEINEILLAQVVRKRPALFGDFLFRSRPGLWQRWLACVPVGTGVVCPNGIDERINALVARSPYCFKDPRFSYTLPAWRPFLGDTVFVCVFRDPGITARSILKECKSTPYLQNLSMTFQRAVEVWTLMYRHILEVHRHEGEWLFIHYNQILNRPGMDRLESFVDARLDRLFPDPNLNRTVASRLASQEALGVYQELCSLAGYTAALQG